MTTVVVAPKIKEENVDVEENENIEQSAAIDLGIPRPATRTTPGLNPITVTPLVSNDDRSKLRKGLRDRARNDSEEISERDSSTPPSKSSPIPGLPPTATGVPNGGQSPHSTTVNGDGNHSSRSNSSSTPAPEAEQPMTKLKRFFSTLLQHSVGLSPVIGDRVRGYVHALLLDTVGAEQFYSAIQTLTNYPMKPFIISFVRTHLQTLQRELECTARLVRMNPVQYLRLHDNAFLDPAGSWAESLPRETPNGEFQGETLPFSSHNKRRSTDRLFIHQGRSEYLSPPPAKRMNGLLTPPWTNGHFALPGLANYLLPGARIPPASLHSVPPAMQQPKMENENGTNNSSEQILARRRCYEEEWKRVLLMLGSISDMVDKARRAVGLLQMRYQDLTETDRLHQGSFFPARSEAPPAVAPSEASSAAGVDLARKTEDLMAKALHQFTEDRVAEVRRKAEEAVMEVKQQAMVQFQKAVMVAESRAAIADAARYEVLKINTDHRRSVRGGSSTQPSPSNDLRNQTCWNCGRTATETCSGCGIAWYCGAFCQHKDWESHHKTCALGRRASSTANSVTFAENLAVDRRTSSPNLQSNSDSDAGTSTDPKSSKMNGKNDDIEIAETASLDERSGFSLSGSESSRSPTAGHSPREMIRSSSVK